MRRDAWLITLIVALTLGCERAPVADVPDPVASDQATFRVVEVAGDLEHPWAMAFLPDGDVLITERPGRLRILREGVLDPTPLEGVPEVYASGQGGLLDIALDPDFASNRLIYLSYAAEGEDGAGTRVARARLGDQGLEDVEVIFEGMMAGGGTALRLTPGLRSRRLPVRHAGRARPGRARAGAGRARRQGRAPAPRRQRAGGQPVRRPGRCRARGLLLRPPQPAGRSPCIPRPAGSGSWSTGRAAATRSISWPPAPTTAGR